MITLTVAFTQDQYDRFRAAMHQLYGPDVEINDDMLVAQMKREASAITYAAENGQFVADWKF